jgi:hypothetical protein
MHGKKLHLAALVVAFFGSTQCFGVDGKAINGRAVSINWRNSHQDWMPKYQDSDGNWFGSIDLFTIVNGKVTRVDTVVSRSVSLCFSAAFNMNGTKIAFYQLGRAGSTNSQKVTVNGGTTTISVYDIATKTITKLVNLAGEPFNYYNGNPIVDGTGGLDWPAGNDIYYLNPKSGGGAPNEVCKVNLTSKAVSTAATFSLGNSYFRRFSLNLAANRCGAQVLGLEGGTPWTSNVGPFPGFSVNGAPDCNSCISSSGNYHCKFSGNHTELYFYYYPGVSAGGEIRALPTGATNDNGDVINGMIRLYTFQNLIPTYVFGTDVEGLAFACNSDKWVLQHVGWYGHADPTQFGTNQVACNWADMAAIRVSNNPKVAQTSDDQVGAGSGTMFLGNTMGDLWVDGGASNAGKYEDANGNWHAVANGGTDYIGATEIQPAGPSQPERNVFRIAQRGRHLNVALPFQAAWRIEIVDSKGRITASYLIDGAAGTLPRDNLAQGACFVRARSAWGTMSSALMLN